MAIYTWWLFVTNWNGKGYDIQIMLTKWLNKNVMEQYHNQLKISTLWDVLSLRYHWRFKTFYIVKILQMSLSHNLLDTAVILKLTSLTNAKCNNVFGIIQKLKAKCTVGVWKSYFNNMSSIQFNGILLSTLQEMNGNLKKINIYFLTCDINSLKLINFRKERKNALTWLL